MAADQAVHVETSEDFVPLVQLQSFYSILSDRNHRGPKLWLRRTHGLTHRRDSTGKIKRNKCAAGHARVASGNNSSTSTAVPAGVLQVQLNSFSTVTATRPQAALTHQSSGSTADHCCCTAASSAALPVAAGQYKHLSVVAVLADGIAVQDEDDTAEAPSLEFMPRAAALLHTSASGAVQPADATAAAVAHAGEHGAKRQRTLSFTDKHSSKHQQAAARSSSSSSIGLQLPAGGLASMTNPHLLLLVREAFPDLTTLGAETVDMRAAAAAKRTGAACKDDLQHSCSTADAKAVAAAATAGSKRKWREAGQLNPADHEGLPSAAAAAAGTDVLQASGSNSCRRSSLPAARHICHQLMSDRWFGIWHTSGPQLQVPAGIGRDSSNDSSSSSETLDAIQQIWSNGLVPVMYAAIPLSSNGGGSSRDAQTAAAAAVQPVQGLGSAAAAGSSVRLMPGAAEVAQWAVTDVADVGQNVHSEHTSPCPVNSQETSSSSGQQQQHGSAKFKTQQHLKITPCPDVLMQEDFQLQLFKWREVRLQMQLDLQSPATTTAAAAAAAGIDDAAETCIDKPPDITLRLLFGPGTPDGTAAGHKSPNTRKGLQTKSARPSSSTSSGSRNKKSRKAKAAAVCMALPVQLPDARCLFCSVQCGSAAVLRAHMELCHDRLSCRSVGGSAVEAWLAGGDFQLPTSNADDPLAGIEQEDFFYRRAWFRHELKTLGLSKHWRDLKPTWQLKAAKALKVDPNSRLSGSNPATTAGEGITTTSVTAAPMTDAQQQQQQQQHEQVARARWRKQKDAPQEQTAAAAVVRGSRQLPPLPKQQQQQQQGQKKRSAAAAAGTAAKRGGLGVYYHSQGANPVGEAELATGPVSDDEADEDYYRVADLRDYHAKGNTTLAERHLMLAWNRFMNWPKLPRPNTYTLTPELIREWAVYAAPRCALNPGLERCYTAHLMVLSQFGVLAGADLVFCMQQLKEARAGGVPGLGFFNDHQLGLVQADVQGLAAVAVKQGIAAAAAAAAAGTGDIAVAKQQQQQQSEQQPQQHKGTKKRRRQQQQQGPANSDAAAAANLDGAGAQRWQQQCDAADNTCMQHKQLQQHQTSKQRRSEVQQQQARVPAHNAPAAAVAVEQMDAQDNAAGAVSQQQQQNTEAGAAATVIEQRSAAQQQQQSETTQQQQQQQCQGGIIQNSTQHPCTLTAAKPPLAPAAVAATAACRSPFAAAAGSAAAAVTAAVAAADAMDVDNSAIRSPSPRLGSVLQQILAPPPPAAAPAVHSPSPRFGSMQIGSGTLRGSSSAVGAGVVADLARLINELAGGHSRSVSPAPPTLLVTPASAKALKAAAIAAEDVASPGASEEQVAPAVLLGSTAVQTETTAGLVPAPAAAAVADSAAVLLSGSAVHIVPSDTVKPDTATAAAADTNAATPRLAAAQITTEQAPAAAASKHAAAVVDVAGLSAAVGAVAAEEVGTAVQHAAEVVKEGDTVGLAAAAAARKSPPSPAPVAAAAHATSLSAAAAAAAAVPALQRLGSADMVTPETAALPAEAGSTAQSGVKLKAAARTADVAAAAVQGTGKVRKASRGATVTAGNKKAQRLQQLGVAPLVNDSSNKGGGSSRKGLSDHKTGSAAAAAAGDDVGVLLALLEVPAVARNKKEQRLKQLMGLSCSEGTTLSSRGSSGVSTPVTTVSGAAAAAAAAAATKQGDGVTGAAVTSKLQQLVKQEELQQQQQQQQCIAQEQQQQQDAAPGFCLAVVSNESGLDVDCIQAAAAAAPVTPEHQEEPLLPQQQQPAEQIQQLHDQEQQQQQQEYTAVQLLLDAAVEASGPTAAQSTDQQHSGQQQQQQPPATRPVGQPKKKAVYKGNKKQQLLGQLEPYSAYSINELRVVARYGKNGSNLEPKGSYNKEQLSQILLEHGLVPSEEFDEVLRQHAAAAAAETRQADSGDAGAMEQQQQQGCVSADSADGNVCNAAARWVVETAAATDAAAAADTTGAAKTAAAAAAADRVVAAQAQHTPVAPPAAALIKVGNKKAQRLQQLGVLLQHSSSSSKGGSSSRASSGSKESTPTVSGDSILAAAEARACAAAAGSKKAERLQMLLGNAPAAAAAAGNGCGRSTPAAAAAAKGFACHASLPAAEAAAAAVDTAPAATVKPELLWQGCLWKVTTCIGSMAAYEVQGAAAAAEGFAGAATAAVASLSGDLLADFRASTDNAVHRYLDTPNHQRKLFWLRPQLAAAAAAAGYGRSSSSRKDQTLGPSAAALQHYINILQQKQRCGLVKIKHGVSMPAPDNVQSLIEQQHQCPAVASYIAAAVGAAASSTTDVKAAVTAAISTQFEWFLYLVVPSVDVCKQLGLETAQEEEGLLAGVFAGNVLLGLLLPPPCSTAVASPLQQQRNCMPVQQLQQLQHVSSSSGARLSLAHQRLLGGGSGQQKRASRHCMHPASLGKAQDS